WSRSLQCRLRIPQQAPRGDGSVPPGWPEARPQPARSSLKIESAEPRHHLVEPKRTGYRRFGTRETAGTLAQPAGRADGRRSDSFLPALCGSGRQGCAVDDLVAKGDVAADQKRGAPRPLAEGTLRPLEGSGGDEKRCAVRHFDRLHENLTRLGKGGMDRQLGASPAEAA